MTSTLLPTQMEDSSLGFVDEGDSNYSLWIDDGLGARGIAGDGLVNGDETRVIPGDYPEHRDYGSMILTGAGQLAVAQWHNYGGGPYFYDLRIWIDDGAGGGVAADGIHNGGEIRVIETSGPDEDSGDIELRTDASGNIILAYVLDGELKLWRDDGDNTLEPGELEVIATTDNHSTPIAFSVDNDGYPVIYYLKTFSTGERRLWRDSVSGPSETIVALNDQLFSSMDINSSGQVVLSYNNASTQHLEIWLDDGRGGGIAGDGLVNGAEVETVLAESHPRRNLSLLRKNATSHWFFSARNDTSDVEFVEATTSSASAPEIEVVGNGAAIADGDTTPSSVDHTDFGAQSVSSGTVSRTFIINNSGAAVLTLGANAASISGANSGDYLITAQPATTVAASGSTTFTVEFDPTAAGLRSATINIANDDGDENPYDFAVQGTGASGSGSQEIDLLGNGVPIADGDATPDLNDHTAFGTQSVFSGSIDRTFTIDNSGSSVLTLGANAVSLTGVNREDYSVVSQPSSAIAGGSSSTFTVRFDPRSSGLRSATVVIANDDSDESPYLFDIEGIGEDSAPLGRVDVGYTVGQHNASTFTASGRLAISYDDSSNGDVKLWVDDGLRGATAGNGVREVSEVRTIDAVGNLGRFTSIALLSNGYLAVSYEDDLDGSIRLWIDDGNGDHGVAGDHLSNGDEVRIVPGSLDSSESSVSADGNGRTALLFYEDPAGCCDDKVIKLWLDDGLSGGVAGNNLIESGEIRVVLSNGLGSIYDVDLAVDPSGRLVAFFAAAQGIWHTWRDDGFGGGAAGNGIVDGSELRDSYYPDTGVGSSITFTNEGYIAVAKQEQYSTGLELWVDDGNGNGIANNAFAETDEVRVISYLSDEMLPSITKFSNGQLAISFYNSNADDMLLWVDDGAGGGTAGDRAVNGGEIRTIDSGGDVGAFSTALVDGSDTLFVHYYDGTNGDLKRFEQSFSTGAEIDVQGNGVSIADEDTTPSLTDDSDFGTFTTADPDHYQTFTVRNTGASVLTLGSNSVGVIGSSVWHVAVQPATTIAAGGSTTFQIVFQPQFSGPGTEQANVSINSDDSDENPYNFVVQATIGSGGSPEIDITGNGNSIVDGDTTPDAADHTDFGLFDTSHANKDVTFTIANTGTSSLTLGSNAVAISGSSDWQVLTQPAAVIAAAGSTTFVIRFDTGFFGPRVETASVTVNSDDDDENPFNFDVRAEIPAPAPEIAVFGYGLPILHGDTIPSLGDGTEFGKLPVGGGQVTRTYTIANLGTADLTLGANSVSLDNAPSDHFTVISQPSSSVAPAGNTSFSIRFDPDAVGPLQQTVTITNNDPDESPYTFKILGRGVNSNDPGLDEDAFLQGRYIQIALASNGALGSQDAVPTAGPFGIYFPRPLANDVGQADGTLAARSDRGKDGWTVGLPLKDGVENGSDGDFFSPGAREEGFGITHDPAGDGSFLTHWANNRHKMRTDIPGTLSDYVNNSESVSVDWDGTIPNGSASGLEVNQSFRVDDSGSDVHIDVTLTNTTGADMTDLYFARNGDIDNNAALSGLYWNTLQVFKQFPGDDEAVVFGTQADGSYAELRTTDPEARVGYGGFSNRDAYAMYNMSGPNLYQSGVFDQDWSIWVAKYFPVIPAGESRGFSFSYGFIPKPPKVSLVHSGFGYYEDDQLIPFAGSPITARLSEPSALPVTVTLAYSGTASPSEYQLQTGTNAISTTEIVIPAGQTEGHVLFDTTPSEDDANLEGDEYVRVSIAGVTNAEVDQGEVDLVIFDDDGNCGSNGDLYFSLVRHEEYDAVLVRRNDLKTGTSAIAGSTFSIGDIENMRLAVDYVSKTVYVSDQVDPSWVSGGLVAPGHLTGFNFRFDQSFQEQGVPPITDLVYDNANQRLLFSVREGNGDGAVWCRGNDGVALANLTGPQRIAVDPVNGKLFVYADTGLGADGVMRYSYNAATCRASAPAEETLQPIDATRGLVLNTADQLYIGIGSNGSTFPYSYSGTPETSVELSTASATQTISGLDFNPQSKYLHFTTNAPSSIGTAAADGSTAPQTIYANPNEQVGDGAACYTNDPGISVSPQRTADSTPAITGTVDEPAATISVVVNGSTYAGINNGDGSWYLPNDTISPALADGTYDVSATATSVVLSASDNTVDELIIDSAAQSPVPWQTRSADFPRFWSFSV